MLTKRQLEKLARIIGSLEAFQHDVEDEKAQLSDAKRLLIKFESEAINERYLRGEEVI